MRSSKLIVLSLLLLVTLLSGCGTYISITGQVVDQNNHNVKGIKVSAAGDTVETDNLGRFTVTVSNVESSKDIDVTIDGRYLGFESKTRTITVFKGQDFAMGKIELFRSKAAIEGTINIPLGLNSFGATPMSTPVGLSVANKKQQYVPGEVIVKFRDTVTPQSVDQLSGKMQLQVLSKSQSGHIVTVKATDTVEKTVAALEKRQDVEYAEPNYYVYPLGMSKTQSSPNIQPLSNDTYYDDQWNLQAINIENAWDRGYLGDSEVTVAVLDTGIKRDIPDLDDNILWDLGKDCVDDDDDPSESWESHGTYVASIIGATPGNWTGIAGINDRVSIVPIRILRSVDNDGAWGTAADLAEGLEWAIYDADVDIINLSVALDANYSSTIADLLDKAEEKGILVVAAAGNEKQTAPDFPASYSTVLSVGAVGPTLQPASYTNHGVDIYAPGGDYSLYPVSNNNCIRAIGANGVDWVQGTSFASAHVAGVAALVLSVEENQTLSAAGLRARLRNTALERAYSAKEGGLVDAFRAIENKDHARLFVFMGQESFSQFTYKTEESTYSYPKDNANWFRLATVDPGANRHLYVWVDRDADDTLSDNDWFAEKQLTIRAGDELDVTLNMDFY